MTARSARKGAAVVLAGSVLGGCASAGLSGAELLAEAGVKTTGLLAQDVAGMSRQLADGDAATAFNATWQACKVPGGSCAVTVPDGAVQAQRAELARAVRLRSQAIAALQRAYAAYRSDLGRVDAAEMDRSVRAAATEAGAYASSFSGSVGVNGARLLSRSLSGSIRYLADLGARASKARSSRDSAAELGRTLGGLGAALRLETRLYDALAEVLTREKIDAHRALLQAGLVSGSETLRPVVDGLNLKLSRDADLVLAKSAPAQTAVQAVVEASERAEVARVQFRYRATVAALEELERLHARLATGEAIDLRALDTHLDAVQSLLRVNRPVAEPAAVPVKRP